MQAERRYFPFQKIEIRDDAKDGPVIEGHAAVFNQLSDPLWGFRERIKPGAFRTALKGDVRALWNHNSDKPLGRTKNKTLTLREDETGLFVSISPPTTTFAADAVESMRRGDVDQMSFAFSVKREMEEWTKENGTNIRTIMEVDELLDVSPVTFPAYPQTDVGVRALLADCDEDCERTLRALQRKRHGLDLDADDIDALRSLSQRLDAGERDEDSDVRREMEQLKETHAEILRRLARAERELRFFRISA